MLAHNKLGEIEILKPTLELGVYLALFDPLAWECGNVPFLVESRQHLCLDRTDGNPGTTLFAGLLLNKLANLSELQLHHI